MSQTEHRRSRERGGPRTAVSCVWMLRGCVRGRYGLERIRMRGRWRRTPGRLGCAWRARGWSCSCWRGQEMRRSLWMPSTDLARSAACRLGTASGTGTPAEPPLGQPTQAPPHRANRVRSACEFRSPVAPIASSATGRQPMVHRQPRSAPGYPPGPYAGPPVSWLCNTGNAGEAGWAGTWPQNIGDVLGTTIRLYFRNFWRYCCWGWRWPAGRLCWRSAGHGKARLLRPRSPPGSLPDPGELHEVASRSGQNLPACRLLHSTTPTPTPGFLARLWWGDLSI